MKAKLVQLRKPVKAGAENYALVHPGKSGYDRIIEYTEATPAGKKRLIEYARKRSIEIINSK